MTLHPSDVTEAKKTGGLRLLVHDATCVGSGFLPGLSNAWSSGALLYRGLGRIDASKGVRNWREALTFLTEYGGDSPVAEVQYWGHGTFGKVWIAKDGLDRARLTSPDLEPLLDRLRNRLSAASSEALVWLRTCETMGGASGHAFAKELSSRLGCRVAGHTHVIGVLQSGLVALRPDEEPSWPLDMGLGPSGESGHGLPSSPAEPSTIHFLTDRLPAALG